jgi:hypothetical protein
VAKAPCAPDRTVIIDGKPKDHATDGWRVVGSLHLAIVDKKLTKVDAQDLGGKIVGSHSVIDGKAEWEKTMQQAICEVGGNVAAITKWPRVDLPPNRDDVFEVFSPIVSDEKKDLALICTPPDRAIYPADRNPFNDVTHGYYRANWLTSDKWRNIVQDHEKTFLTTRASEDRSARHAAATKVAVALAEQTAREGYPSCWWAEALKDFGAAP